MNNYEFNQTKKMTTTPPPIERVIHSPPPIKRGKRARSVIENNNENADRWKGRQYALEYDLGLVPLPDDEDKELIAVFGEVTVMESNAKYLCVRTVNSAETEKIDEADDADDIDASEWHSVFTPTGSETNDIVTCFDILHDNQE